MPRPKNKNAALPATRSKPRDGAGAKPRARAKRPPPGLYSQAEIHEIFRRFCVQRPEPKGELEHIQSQGSEQSGKVMGAVLNLFKKK